MKKILFATTALVMTAGYAAADVTVNGSANMGLKYEEDRTTDDGSNGETYMWNELDFGMNGSATTDSGIEFGASIDLDAGYKDNYANQGTAGMYSDNIDFDPEAYISANGLTLTIGEVDPATDDFGMDDLGFDGIGIDDTAEKVAGNAVKGFNNNDTYGGAEVQYQIGDNTFLATVGGDASSEWAVSYQGAYMGFSYGIGYDEATVSALGGTNGEVDATWLDLGYTAGQIYVGGFFMSADVKDVDTYNNYGLEASYTMDALTVSAAYAYDDAADEDSYGLGASYDLGSGLALAGAVGDVEGKTHADLGVTMKF